MRQRDLEDCAFVGDPTTPKTLNDLYERFGGRVESDEPISVSVRDYTEIVLTMGRCIGPFNLIVGPHGGVLMLGHEILPAGA